LFLLLLVFLLVGFLAYARLESEEATARADPLSTAGLFPLRRGWNREHALAAQ
jgi:hypothetical protein